MNGIARAVAFSQDDDLDAQLLHLKGADLKRALRVLEERDARQRDENQLHDAGRTVELVDKIEVLPDGMMMLHYDSYLAHQRYYDDWKHADIPLLNFGNLRYHCFPSFDNDCLDQNQLVIQQQKSLGKGGLCWDAAFVLAEHLMMTHRQWYPLTYHPNILELGAGTGLSGLALAKFLPCNVTITDLPELLNLMQQNVTQNFSFTVHKEEEKRQRNTNLLIISYLLLALRMQKSLDGASKKITLLSLRIRWMSLSVLTLWRQFMMRQP